MDILKSFLTNPDVQTMMLSVMSIVLTALIGIAATAFTRWTGIKIEQTHQENLHRAIRSAVESALLHGPDVAMGTIKAHAVQHLRESVPGALKALVPGDGVLDTLIERYAREALNRIGEPK